MKRLIRIKEVLWAVSMFGLVAIIARLFQGLGATTALSDANTWGLWKIGNMVAGVALGTCGFVMAAVYYVFKRERYHNLVRPAVLIAFLGYGSSCFSLFLDIGIPWRIWHAIIYWNIHSFLFEVAMCVMFYFSVTTLELIPVLTENRFHRFAHFLHRVSLPFILLGITLSTMHHTTLGSLFLVSPTRMYPVWFSPWIWGLFITSAIGSGLFTLVFIALGYDYLYEKKRKDYGALENIAAGGSLMLVIYGIMKIADLTRRGLWPMVFGGDWEGGVFIAEFMIQVIIPVGIVMYGRLRRSPNWLAVAGLSSMIGVVMNRIDVGILAYFRTAGSFYFPSLAEFFVTFGVYAAAALVFLYVVENFDVFEHPPVRPLDMKGIQKRLIIDAPSSVSIFAISNPMYRYSGVAMISLVLAIGVFSSSLLKGAPLKQDAARPAVKQDEKGDVLNINGNGNNVAVVFKHKEHQQRIGKEEGSCEECHHLIMPEDMKKKEKGEDIESSCSSCHAKMELSSPVFDHTSHHARMGGNKSCPECHDISRPKWKDNTKPCFECHEKDMEMKRPASGAYHEYVASSYVDAMHRQCVECHIRKQKESDKPVLEECYTCHGDVKLTTVR